MQIKIHNEGWTYFILSILLTIISFAFSYFLGFFLLLISSYIFYFFRDPQRFIPLEDVIVSPADGLVTFIGNSKNPLNDESDKNIYKKTYIKYN